MEKHVFVICAYKESRYLEECIQSLVNQTQKTKVIIASSTPSDYIDGLAEKYGLECFYRDGKSDIKDDWNYACEIADAQWVTVAHQDDVYCPEYAETIGALINSTDDAYIAFSDYRALIDGKIIDNKNSKIRRLLLIPMRSKHLSKSIFWKRRVLSLGNSICCPTVTYNKSKINGNIFTSELKFNIDWDTFLKYAEMEGRFLYSNKPLVYYRVHSEATTVACMNNSVRVKDDNYMMGKFWPSVIVKIIMFFYKKAYDEYTK